MLRFSPDGSRLMLAVSGEESASLWLLPIPDGARAEGKPRQLFAENTSWRYAPPFSWMPDSRSLVLSLQDTPSSRSRLWLADTRNENMRALTADVADESYPDVSPDGSKIAFTSGGADYDLVLVPMDGSPVKELLASSRSEHSAAWIPATDQFVYVSDRSGQEELRLHRLSENQDLPVVSQRDFPKEITQLLRDPVVSPDGRQVAYDRKAVDGRRFIWISQLVGGVPVRLTQGAGGEAVPTWSPDGQWVAFLMTEGGVLQLAKAPSGGNQPSQTLVVDASLASAPEWSPDGEWIACQNREGVLLASPDGKHRRLLPRVRGTALLWSRDSRTIYTIAPRMEGGSQLLSIDISTGVVKTETSFGNELAFGTGMNPGLRFSMAPDGRSFSASVRRLRTDIWILEGFNRR
jgi:Tol biopolymer transport system component